MILARYSGEQQEERRIRRWRTGQDHDPRWTQMRGPIFQGYAQTPEIIGGLVAEQQAASDGNTIKWGAIATGVITGVSVWLVTRLLNNVFGIEKK